MILFALFSAFFLANLFGYGGGPASIPLMHAEIVERFGWLSNQAFSTMLALGNALPGPIATKIAAYVGYEMFGWTGVLAALAATILPSAIALIWLLKLFDKHRESLAVKGMSLAVQPVIAVLMAVLTWELLADAQNTIGFIHLAVIASISIIGIIKLKWHPAFLIAFAFIYGGVLMPYF